MGGTPYIDCKGNCTAEKFFENVVVKLKLFQHVMEPTFNTGKDNHSILIWYFQIPRIELIILHHEEPLKLAIQGHHFLRFNDIMIENKDKQGYLSKLNYVKVIT